MWWCAPIVPASMESEAGESLEPGWWRWCQGKMMHSSPGYRARLQLKKKKKRKEKKNHWIKTALST